MEKEPRIAPGITVKEHQSSKSSSTFLEIKVSPIRRGGRKPRPKFLKKYANDDGFPICELCGQRFADTGSLMDHKLFCEQGRRK